MGLFGKRKSNGTQGRGVVISIGPTKRGARQTGKRDVEHTVRMRVELEGVAAFETDVVDDVPLAKTPLIGDALPLRVGTDDPRDVSIEWDDMPDLATRSMGSAAAARRGDVAGAADAFGFTLRNDPPTGRPGAA
ncbi:MAG: hypothetical protein K8R99_09525 [Actinomycetia bacterium]|nr:hypothetical protein [Actinomycetes bacterium]